MLVNAGRRERLGPSADFPPERGVSVPATRIAEETLGRPIPNTALLGAFLALTGLADLDALDTALAEHPPDVRVRLLGLRRIRPFPHEELRAALAGLDELVVLERAISPGRGAILADEIRASLHGVPDMPRVYGTVAGLGGRDIPTSILPELLACMREETPVRMRIVDLVEPVEPVLPEAAP